MSVCVIGGMDRLVRRYTEAAEGLGIRLKVFNSASANMASRVGNVDAIVVFTNMISHRAKKEAVMAAKSRNIPVMMCHSCGISTLKDCLGCLKKGQIGEA